VKSLSLRAVIKRFKPERIVIAMNTYTINFDMDNVDFMLLDDDSVIFIDKENCNVAVVNLNNVNDITLINVKDTGGRNRESRRA